MKIFDNTAVAAPDILLPREGTDLKKWAVVACDQYTSQPDYWKRVEDAVADAPSTLRLILPEVYLETDSEDQIAGRLEDIKNSIDSYLMNGIWADPQEGFVILDRKTPVNDSRKGLVAAVDLEKYSFEPGNRELIRATEGTVLSRIPPRVKIRKNARVELPHIMLLINDPEDTVTGAALKRAKDSGRAPVYDTDLLEDSGHVTGYLIPSESEEADLIISALDKLRRASPTGMLFAVGDGNHSLASAKAHWENVREGLSEEARLTHPARYAMAEIVNIHDSGLQFEPIHRIVFDASPEDLISDIKALAGEENVKISDSAITEGQVFTIVSEGRGDIFVSVSNPPHSLSVGTVQMMLDKSGRHVDYIHGEDTVRQLAAGSNTGILLPDVSKDSFFETIETEGVFPRKTFSMGEACEKRFYLEAKRID